MKNLQKRCVEAMRTHAKLRPYAVPTGRLVRAGARVRGDRQKPEIPQIPLLRAVRDRVPPLPRCREARSAYRMQARLPAGHEAMPRLRDLDSGGAMALRALQEGVASRSSERQQGQTSRAGVGAAPKNASRTLAPFTLARRPFKLEKQKVAFGDYARGYQASLERSAGSLSLVRRGYASRCGSGTSAAGVARQGGCRGRVYPGEHCTDRALCEHRAAQSFRTGDRRGAPCDFFRYALGPHGKLARAMRRELAA